MNQPIHRLKGLYLSAMALACLGSAASEPEKALGMPIQDHCLQQNVRVLSLIEVRDKGIPLARVLEVIASFPNERPFRRALVDEIYDSRRLNNDMLLWYSLSECQARAAGVTPEPLANIEADLYECQLNLKDRDCGWRVRKKLLGLPADYQPSVHQVAPPAQTRQ